MKSLLFCCLLFSIVIIDYFDRGNVDAAAVGKGAVAGARGGKGWYFQDTFTMELTLIVSTIYRQIPPPL